MEVTHNQSINPWVIKTLKKLRPRRVVDAGSGRGDYGKMIAGCLKNCTVIGVEIYEPYIRVYQANLKKYYLRVILGDIREVIHEEEVHGDLIIFGDILEHLPKKDVHPLVGQAIKKFKYVLVSAPIGFTPQTRPKKGSDVSLKNLHGRHLCGLTGRDFTRYNVMDYREFTKSQFTLLIKGIRT